jgi:hypothetical protein
MLLTASLADCGKYQRADRAAGPTTTTSGSVGDGALLDGAATSGPATTAAPPTTARPAGPAGARPTPTTARPGTAGAAPDTVVPPPDDGATRPGSGDVRPTTTDDGSQGPPGAFARTLLRPAPATTIVIERFAQSGAPVADASVSRSAGIVHDVSFKAVDVRDLRTLPGGAKAWTADDIRATADAASAVPQGNGRAVLHLLQLRGTFEGSEEVLGVSVRGDVIALFPDSIESSATPLVSAAAIEDAVVLHELGHVLGLVDLARDTGRADPNHPGHSVNTHSVMYWAVESSLVGQVLNGPPPRDFDNDDLADLRALRNGA